MVPHRRVLASWSLAIFLCVAYLYFGGSKVLMFEPVVDRLHDDLRVPVLVVPIIGVFELLGALLVVLPKTRFLGAQLLAIIMVGAVGTHFLHADWTGWPLPAALLVLQFVVLWLHWDKAPWRPGGWRHA